LRVQSGGDLTYKMLFNSQLETDLWHCHDKYWKDYAAKEEESSSGDKE
jgi:hypothetical protein